jgi:hypothetical protein
MMYRFVDTKEVIPTDIFVTDISRYIRPLRDIDDLTDIDISKVSREFGITITEARAIGNKLDELRSRPKETEKERWIRGHMRENNCISETCYKYMSSAWDAAYEAGRKAK